VKGKDLFRIFHKNLAPNYLFSVARKHQRFYHFAQRFPLQKPIKDGSEEGRASLREEA
jgi:hypothetical protein